jgi:hypothetical protein
VSREYPPEELADLEAMVARGLPRWGVAPSARVSLLDVSENAKFAVSDTVRRRELIVRVHRIGYSSLETDLAGDGVRGLIALPSLATPQRPQPAKS